MYIMWSIYTVYLVYENVRCMYGLDIQNRLRDVREGFGTRNPIRTPSIQLVLKICEQASRQGN